MEDDRNKKNLEKSVPRQSLTNISDDSTFLQPIWVRRGSICSDIMDRKFMESQLYFVLYCGTFLWSVYLFSQII